jgi:hypothetical protein
VEVEVVARHDLQAGLGAGAGRLEDGEAPKWEVLVEGRLNVKLEFRTWAAKDSESYLVVVVEH